MSKRASPTAIGLFMIGAIVLAVAGIVTLASTTWFDERPVFISYFEESVNGLEVGAPVKFKGVPVGRVTELLIRIDLDEKTFQVPVLYEINLSRLTSEAGTYVPMADEEVLQQQIVDGLRAQLQMESIVTGQLYVELTYVSDAGPPDFMTGAGAYPQIPTVPSLWAALGEEAGSLVADLQEFDVGAINRNLMLFLARANEKLDQLDVEEINASLLEAAGAVEALAQSEQIELALQGVPEVTAGANQTLAEVQALVRTLEGAISPMQVQLETTTGEVTVTLQALREAVEETQQLLSTQSGLGYHMEEALANLSEAAEALRRLAESLERNPGVLIRGKRQPDR